MPYAGFIYGHDDQVKAQRSALRALAEGDTIRFFIEPQIDNKYDIKDREVLQKALQYSVSTPAIFAISSLKGMTKRNWITLNFLAESVEELGIEIAVADDSALNKHTVAAVAAYANSQRKHISERSKAALKEIKDKIDAGGVHITKSGRKMTRFGIHDKLEDAGKKGNDANAQLARNRDDEMWPVIDNLMKRGMGYNAIARHLNNLGFPTPAAQAKHKRTTKGEWYASTVRNIVLRREEQ